MPAASRSSGVELVNLGAGGNCHADQFVARAIKDTPAECISLKIGINIAGQDTLKHRTFAPAVHGFLDTVRDGHPETPVLVVSPIICPVLENSPGPIVIDPDGGKSVNPHHQPLGKTALSLRRMREILQEVVLARQPDDPNLFYLDGLSLFGEDDLGDLPDGVHPNGDGYVRIGERFAKTVFASGGCFSGVLSRDRCWSRALR